MNTVFKIISYISISFSLAYIVSIGSDDFFGVFREESVALLSTIFAISISAITLISSELSQLRRNYPKAKISNVFKNLKQIIIIQILLILILLLLLVIRDSISKTSDIVCFKLWYSRFCDAYIIYTLLYFFEIIYDLGSGLMELLGFGNDNEK